jgi:hypothetical protein
MSPTHRYLCNLLFWLSLRGGTVFRSLLLLLLACCLTAASSAAPPPRDVTAITTLTVAEAEDLVATESDMMLHSLVSLTPDVARVLTNFQGGLFLDGLKTISVDVASVLAGHKHVVCLNGLESLSPDVATILAESKGGILALNGVTDMSPDVAEKLSKHEGWLFIGGISTLAPEVVSPFAKHVGDVTFGTKGSITPEALAIVKANDHLHIGSYWLVQPEVSNLNDAAPAARAWTSRSGKALGNGSFLGMDGEHVRIQLASGKVGRIEKGKLSQEDIQFVERAAANAASAEDLVIEEDRPGGGAVQRSAMPSEILVATRLAWRELQEADARIVMEQFAFPSERFRAAAFAYSRIPLANADPTLVRHIQRCLEAHKQAAQVCFQYESEMNQIQARVNNAAGVGALIGGAASEPGTAEANAAGLALLFGGFAQASVTSESQALLAKMQAAWKTVGAEIDACANGDIEVAKYLSEKYGEPFLDAF